MKNTGEAGGIHTRQTWAVPKLSDLGQLQGQDSFFFTVICTKFVYERHLKEGIQL